MSQTPENGSSAAVDRMDDSFVNGAANKDDDNNHSQDSSKLSMVPSAANTPHGSVADHKRPTLSLLASYYGRPIPVASAGGFPAVASILGPYFSVGRLGKGTFCSIHQCINMEYWSGKPRLAAAKVEIGDFVSSGILAGEATILDFLDSKLPDHTVPVYMGNLRAGGDISAILMEYLPGKDLHLIRDWATRNKNTRRLSVQDSVYLAADMILPHLQRMHEVGIVHRDVKPSNVVKRGLKDFVLVDFGLSKTIIASRDSTQCDPDKPWGGSTWMHPPDQPSKGYYRIERPTAEFRGTSMYASLRVHQLKDYAPRDDIWGLLYVFCDLLTGGLPWMEHAGVARDRQACQKLKERIHGEEEGTPDQTERMLQGRDYHVKLFSKYEGRIDPPEGMSPDDIADLPEPLQISKDVKKVELLRKAFQHLQSLTFWDIPDYELIKSCIKGFLEGDTYDDDCTPIDWQEHLDTENEKKESVAKKKKPVLGDDVPEWEMHDVDGSIEPIVFVEAEMKAAVDPAPELSGEAADIARLPVELQFRIAQMEYNTIHCDRAPTHLALRDWLHVALPILYGEWDTRKFEKGGHRTNEDGYRREFLVTIIEKCLDCAFKFDNFQGASCVFESPQAGCASKKRKISSTVSFSGSHDTGIDLLAVSQAFFRLRLVKRREMKKSRAPPPLLSFG